MVGLYFDIVNQHLIKTPPEKPYKYPCPQPDKKKWGWFCFYDHANTLVKAAAKLLFIISWLSSSTITSALFSLAINAFPIRGGNDLSRLPNINMLFIFCRFSTSAKTVLSVSRNRR